jgi:2-polyprenyl-3-methyl-5-hydroxy-6-metoxy-1,4-benzoquinol methylase
VFPQAIFCRSELDPLARAIIRSICLIDTTRNKIKLLVTITSYGTNQDQLLEQLVQEYRKMRFQSHIVVLSNVEKSVPQGVELRVGLPTKDPWSLPFAHKQVMADGRDQYDLFIYSENDVMICESHIDAFLDVYPQMPNNELPGFLLYEVGPNGVKDYVGLYGHYHWDPTSVVVRGPYTFAFLTNEHSASYLLTQAQLKRAIDSGGYLMAPNRGAYDMACTASTDPYTRGGFRKLICLSRLEDFSLHHLPNKYSGPNSILRSQNFDKQKTTLLSFARDTTRPVSLFSSETKLPAVKYSKDYYEPAREDVLRELPPTVRSVLSVGSGAGLMEQRFAEMGMEVTAVPIDPVIGSCLTGTAVETVYGDLPTVRSKLNGRRFDCLFLSNILHLIKNPSNALKEFTELLVPGGMVLVVSPNLSKLRLALQRSRRSADYYSVGNYEASGVSFVSKGLLKRWLRDSSCEIQHIRWISGERFQWLGKLGIPLFDSLLSSEIIALARKAG